jgi:hypothetical protein
LKIGFVFSIKPTAERFSGNTSWTIITIWHPFIFLMKEEIKMLVAGFVTTNIASSRFEYLTKWIKNLVEMKKKLSSLLKGLSLFFVNPENLVIDIPI